MEPRIETLHSKKLIGNKLKMSLMDNKTGVLWAGFSPRIKEIKNKQTTDRISMQVYDSSYFNEFNPAMEFEKWATVEVTDFREIPAQMEPFTLVGGQYAVFDYRGSGDDNRIFQYIFNTWLPNSIYALDNRPHFEVLGEKYKNNDPNSEEEIWIPIKNKI